MTYSIAGQLPFGRDVTVTTPHGTVSLTRGDVTVWIEDNTTRVLSYDGRGKVESENRQVRFREGQRVVASEAQLPREPLSIAENLVKNGELTQGLESWTPIDVRERGRTDVLGERHIETQLIAGLRSPALHFFRDSQKDSHNETGVSQEINRDVTPYRVINLSGWVKVNFASLSGGGYLGSEYPMMVRVNFTDDKGSRQVWSKGSTTPTPRTDLRTSASRSLVANGIRSSSACISCLTGRRLSSQSKCCRPGTTSTRWPDTSRSSPSSKGERLLVSRRAMSRITRYWPTSRGRRPQTAQDPPPCQKPSMALPGRYRAALRFSTWVQVPEIEAGQG